MFKERLISSALCAVVLAASVSAQSAGRAAQSATAAPQKIAAPQTAAAITLGPSNLYSWQVVPSIGDQYESIHHPQPVCRKDGSLFKISIFTSYNNAVRVGEITTPADTYQLLSGAGRTLPGKRDDFAAASVVKNSGSGDSTVYIFGGTDLTNELNDVYSYDASGFSSSPVATIPNNNTNTIVGNRSGATAVAANGLIYLFGGRRGNSLLDQVLEFNPNTDTFTILSQTSSQVGYGTMPQALYGARGMAKATTSGVYIYLVGARTTAGGGPGREIYRFNVQTKMMQKVMDAAIPITQQQQPLQLPANIGVPTVTWDPSGNVRIIASIAGASVGTWSGMQAWILNDTYGGQNDGRATLTPAPFYDAVRARNDTGAVKCGDSTYLVGGTYGHGSTLADRSKLVDKLGMQVLKKFVDVKTF